MSAREPFAPLLQRPDLLVLDRMRVPKLVAGAPPASALFLFGVLALATTVAWLVFADRLVALELLGVPTMRPHFADVRTITGAGTALAQGLDPLVQNPGDPWGRALNYPRIWVLPAWLGIQREHSAYMAAALIGAFGIGLLALRPLVTTSSTALLLVVTLFSPVTFLAVERANTDLLVFGMLAVTAGLTTVWPRTASTLVAAAAALKLFPIFALGGLCSEAQKRSLRALLTVTVLFAIYIVAIRDDLPLIRVNSQRWNPISYGIDLMPRAATAVTGWPFSLLLGCAACFVVLVVAVAGRWRCRARLGAAATPHSLAAFRIGAGVFTGTFCLGSNFDYRLVFLMLAIPQLVSWTAATRGFVRLGMQTLLVCVLLFTWSMTWRKGLVLVAGRGAEDLGLMLDEVLAWLLACGLLTALVMSLPEWMVATKCRQRAFLDADPD